MTTFDPTRYKATTREQWQTAAKAWNDWGPLLRAWLGPATEIMLDMAKIAPGARVLDVAAGAGDQTLQAAARVGPGGTVLATDIAPNILAFAAANARAAGYASIDTKVMDGEEIDVPEGTFDAVISRVGLIYFPDQQKALAGMKRALKARRPRRGDRLQHAREQPVLLDPGLDHSPPRQSAAAASGPAGTVQSRRRRCPGGGAAQGWFSRRGEPDRGGAGKLRSAAECVRFEQESFGALHQMLASLDEAGRASRLARDRKRTDRVRGPDRLRGTVRARGGGRDQMSGRGRHESSPSTAPIS